MTVTGEEDRRSDRLGALDSFRMIVGNLCALGRLAQREIEIGECPPDSCDPHCRPIPKAVVRRWVVAKEPIAKPGAVACVGVAAPPTSNRSSEINALTNRARNSDREYRIIRESRAGHEQRKVLCLRRRAFVYGPYNVARNRADH